MHQMRLLRASLDKNIFNGVFDILFLKNLSGSEVGLGGSVCLFTRVWLLLVLLVPGYNHGYRVWDATDLRERIVSSPKESLDPMRDAPTPPTHFRWNAFRTGAVEGGGGRTVPSVTVPGGLTTHRPVSRYQEASQPTDRCHGTRRPHNPQTGVKVQGGLTTHRLVSRYQEASQPTGWCHGTRRPHNPQTGVMVLGGLTTHRSSVMVPEGLTTHRLVSWYQEASQPTDWCHGTRRPHNPQTGVTVPGGLTTHRPVSWYQEASQPTGRCHGTRRPHNPQASVMVPGWLTTHRLVSRYQEASQPTDWCHGTRRPHNPQTGVMVLGGLTTHRPAQGLLALGPPPSPGGLSSVGMGTHRSLSS